MEGKKETTPGTEGQEQLNRFISSKLANDLAQGKITINQVRELIGLCEQEVIGVEEIDVEMERLKVERRLERMKSVRKNARNTEGKFFSIDDKELEVALNIISDLEGTLIIRATHILEFCLKAIQYSRVKKEEKETAPEVRVQEQSFTIVNNESKSLEEILAELKKSLYLLL